MSSAKAYKSFVAREASRKRMESMKGSVRKEEVEDSSGLLQRRAKRKESPVEKEDDTQEAMRSYFEMVRKLAGGNTDA